MNQYFRRVFLTSSITLTFLIYYSDVLTFQGQKLRHVILLSQNIQTDNAHTTYNVDTKVHIPSDVLCSLILNHKLNSSMFWKLAGLPPYTPASRFLYSMRRDLDLSVKSEFMRSGVGLEEVTTETGARVYKENGVEYRDFPFREPANNSFYSSPFEAHIPFDEELFFEGNMSAIEEFHAGGGGGGNKKIILWWMDKVNAEPHNGLQPLRACPDLPCVVTSQNRREMTNQSHALIFQGKVFVYDLILGVEGVMQSFMG